MRTPTADEQLEVVDALAAAGIDASIEYPGIVSVRLTVGDDIFGWTGQHDWRDLEIQMEHVPGGWGHENGDPTVVLEHGDDADTFGVARRIALAVVAWRFDNPNFNTCVHHDVSVIQ